MVHHIRRKIIKVYLSMMFTCDKLILNPIESKQIEKTAKKHVSLFHSKLAVLKRKFTRYMYFDSLTSRVKLTAFFDSSAEFWKMAAMPNQFFFQHRYQKWLIFYEK